MMGGKNQKNQEAMMILKNSPLPPSFTFISMQEINEDDKIIEKLTKYFGEDHSKWPQAVKKTVLDEDTKDHMAMTALSMAITYLE
jgi:hypothetical protein